MRLDYREIFTTRSGLSYLELKSPGGSLLCVQGPMYCRGRIKKAFESAKAMERACPDNAFSPLSFGIKESTVSSVYEGQCGGSLKFFLSHVTPPLQYACGRKIGRALKAIHDLPLDEKEQSHADKRQGRFMERIATYVASLPHFKGDQAAMDAISNRYDNFTCFRRVMRYGQLRADRIMVRGDSSVALLPSPSFGPGDACEDFALMELDFAGLYPACCAGIIDGYFQGATPPARFWVNFAMHSAVYSLWRCGTLAKESRKAFLIMQSECARISSDFDSFKRPYPSWYSNHEVRRAKDTAIIKAL